jgi:hypothetical protein
MYFFFGFWDCVWVFGAIFEILKRLFANIALLLCVYFKARVTIKSCLRQMLAMLELFYGKMMML